MTCGISLPTIKHFLLFSQLKTSIESKNSFDCTLDHFSFEHLVKSKLDKLVPTQQVGSINGYMTQ